MSGYVRKTTRPYNRAKPVDKLQLRAKMLLARGFDVPPSKKKQYDSLMNQGLRMSEVREILELE